MRQTALFCLKIRQFVVSVIFYLFLIECSPKIIGVVQGSLTGYGAGNWLFALAVRPFNL
jgi:ABC-type microcin C transport system permease subunit YejE